MSGETVWGLTRLGRNRVKSIYGGEGSSRILSYLYDNKTASESELSNAVGGEGLRGKLRKYRRAGLVDILGGE